MAKLWTDILVPVVIVGAVAAQTVGVEMNRASKVRRYFPVLSRQDTLSTDTDSLKADSLRPKALPDTTLALPDTTRSPLDSLAEEEDFDLFADAEEDTLPRVFARDTMKVPDSLKITDPFLYQWYVATKDGYTHRIVVDSLKAEGDTLLWPRIDSLYLADSTLQAKIAWEKKWASMSKAERKKWTFENIELPAILHKQDSIQHRKDSIKQRKDSILQATPRILETAFLPDSLYYKRLVTWKHDRLYNRVETFEWDTTANYRFYDYPFMKEDVGASWLGMPGSPVQQYNFFRRGKGTAPSFFEPLESWTYSAENLPMFNTKTPYTELEYYGNLINSSDLSADAFRIFTTQNIIPSLNIALEMKRYGGAGWLKKEHTDNRTYFVAANYLGKKYLAHAGFITDKVLKDENGGVQDNSWIRDTTVDVREIEVQLATAANRSRKMTLFLDQSYRIPFEFIERLKHRGDTSWVQADTLNTDITTGFIGTSTEYSTYTKKYADNTDATLSAFYRDQFNINPAKSADSLRNMRLENRIFVRLQPWHEDAIVSKVEGGVGNRFQTFYLQQPGEVLYKGTNHRWNSFYVYAGAEGKLNRYLQWDANALYNFAGYEANDFTINAHAAFRFYPFRRHKDSPITLDARFETSLKEPEFYQQHFYSNHFKWENNFSKTSVTKIQASLSIPRWNLKAEAGYALLANNVYYDTLGVARQNEDPMSVVTAGLSHHLALGPLHLENAALFQLSSKPEVLPLPTLALNLRWYLQFNVVDPKVLKLQLGANARYTTLWYAPSFNPVAGVFMNQNEEQYGNCLVFDVFANFQWKKCCLFIKYENAGRGWPMTNRDYFTAHHYIQVPAMFKIGISWPFYPRLGVAKTMSARAGSGMGGGGGGGLGGGLRGAISGMGGR